MENIVNVETIIMILITEITKSIGGIDIIEVTTKAISTKLISIKDFMFICINIIIVFKEVFIIEDKSFHKFTILNSSIMSGFIKTSIVN